MKPMAEKRKLPTLKKLIDNGVHADIESTITPSTRLAWFLLPRVKILESMVEDFSVPLSSGDEQREQN